MKRPAALLLLLISAWATNARLRGEDGRLSLLVAVPLSKDNHTQWDPGLFHLASARLAVDHFNARNNTVIPNLLDYTKDCRISLDAQAVDTGTNSHQAMEYVVEKLQTEGPIDAIAGPYNEIPAQELSVLATGMKTPLVAHRSLDANLLNPARHPFFSQVAADFFSEMSFVGTYLEHMNRTNFVAILYCTVPSVIQKKDVLRSVLARRGFDQVRSFGYTPKYIGETEEGESFASILDRVKQTGYRTIVLLPNRADLDSAELGPAITDAGLDQGKHFWTIASGEEPRDGQGFLMFLEEVGSKNQAHFLNGSTYLFHYDGYEINKHVDFREYLQDMDISFYERVMDFLPTAETPSELLKFGNTSLPFRAMLNTWRSWAPGASFMYDAVMTVGFGACKATSGSNITTMTGEMHLEGIRSLEFPGVSGDISFGSTAGQPGSRAANTVPFAVSNIAPLDDPYSLVVRAVESLNPRTGQWHKSRSFMYIDGSSAPPPLLREQPDQNYISKSARLFGLVAFCVALISVVASFSWVFVNRHQSVVVAAQPMFLYALCFASGMLCICILLSAFDESWGFGLETLDGSCFAWSWLDALGRMITYCALFTKLWRANRCMRYNTNNVALWQVLWPCTLLVLFVLICLSVWTVKGDYGWERQVIDDISGESIGVCTGETSDTYFAPIYALSFVPIVLACIMAWRSMGIDDLYSDSKWVLAFILVQIQVLLVGAPLVMILNETNPSARYVGLTLLTFSFPISSMGLIILPKVMLVRRIRNKSNDETEDRQDCAEEVNAEEGNATRRTSALGDADRLSRIRPRMQIVTIE